MKVCFFGNTGHFFTAFQAKPEMPELDYAAYCSSFTGETFGPMASFSAEAGCSLKAYDDLEKMLRTERPDILVVDNRFTERFHAERLALETGVHVYADKPIATSLAELRVLYQLAKRSNRLLWAMHTVRYDPWYYTAKKLIDAGEIGTVRMVNCQKSYRLGERLSFYRDRATYGGTIPWVTIHAIDMISMSTNADFHTVYATQSRIENRGYGDMEILTTSSFTLAQDILATVSTDYYRPAAAHSHDDDRMRVVGTEGILDVRREGADHQVRLLSDKACGLRQVAWQTPPPIFADFVRATQGRGSDLLTMEDCFYNAYVAIEAQHSADHREERPLMGKSELLDTLAQD